MKQERAFLALLMLGTISVGANAAITCLPNKDTGQFEVRGGSSIGKSRNSECNILNLQAAVDSAGTKIGSSAPISRASQSLPDVVGGSTSTNKVAAAIVEAAKPVTPAKADQVWQIRISDETVFGAIKRWSKIAGYQLSWETDNRDFPAQLEASYPGDFEQAVGGVMASLERSQYPLRACLFDNAIRVIHKAKRCED